MKSAVVSQDFAAKFATERETPYTRWVREEGLDIIGSFYVQNLHTVERDLLLVPETEIELPSWI